MLLEKVKELNVGNGLNDDVDIGPLINENGTEKVQDHLTDATDKGARILCGGTKWDGEYEGHFFEPTLLDNITDDMKVMNEETFGPLLPLQTFKTEEEAIKAANNTKYGLRHTSLPKTSTVPSAYPNHWNTEWSASTKSFLQSQKHHSEESNNPVSEKKADTTGLMILL